MKTTAKFISASLATLLVSASAVTAFAAETKDITVSLRIEGVDSCVLYDNYEIPQGSTAADLIQYADKLSDDVTVTGTENNYITDCKRQNSRQIRRLGRLAVYCKFSFTKCWRR